MEPTLNSHSELEDWVKPIGCTNNTKLLSPYNEFSGHQIVPGSLWDVLFWTLPYEWISIALQSLTLWSLYLIRVCGGDLNIEFCFYFNVSVNWFESVQDFKI